MNSLQLENLQNYFLQNNLKVLDLNNKLTKFDYILFLNRLNNFKDANYNSFLYLGSDPFVVLSLINYKIENNVELIFANQNINIDGFTKTEVDSLFIKEEGNNNFYIYTSGTTGDPKPVKTNLEDMINNIKPTKQKDNIWLLTYDIKSFAGLQVLLTAVISQNTIYSTNYRSKVNELIEIAYKYKVNAISGTPTFWRIFISSTRSKNLNLRLITLGGEVVEEDILLKIKKLYPNAKLTQIYATTEFGKVFSVTDNKPGFPKDYLIKYNLKIVNNELFIKYGKTYTSTKDYVELVGKRVFFIGRNSDFVKIAGNKVNLKKIEQEIIKIENIQDAKTSIKSSKIVGNVLVLDVILDIDTDYERLQLQKKLRQRFEPFQIPKIINYLENLETNSNLKK